MYLNIINDSLSKMITDINSNSQSSVLSKKQTINEGRLTDKYSNFQANSDSSAPLLKRKNQSNEYEENENNKTILYIDNSYSIQQNKQLQDQVINKARSIFDNINIKYFAKFVSVDPRETGEGNNSNCVIQDIQEEQPTNVLIFTDEDFSTPTQSNCIVPGVVIFIFESKDNLSFNPKKYVRGENGNKVIYLDSYVEESYNISEAKNKSDQICSICGKPYKGYGNNAYPVNDGRCCDDCNYSAVIPARIKAIQKNEVNSDVSESYDDEDDSWVPKDDYEAQSTLYGDKPVYDYDVYDESLNKSNLNEWTANYWTAYSKDNKSQKGFDDVYEFLSFINKYSDQISKVSSNECQPIDLQKFLSYTDMQRGELFNITPQQFGHYWPDKSITNYGKAQLKNQYGINEGLSEDDKVDLWEQGKRKVNVKACLDNKLLRYFDIANKKGYNDLCNIIETEAKSRGLQLSKQGPSGQQFTPIQQPNTPSQPVQQQTTQQQTTYKTVLDELIDIAAQKKPRVVTNGMDDSDVEYYEDQLMNELVPGRGDSDTLAGEILSAWNYGVYRLFNDGDWFYGFGNTWNTNSQRCVQYLKDYVGPGLGAIAINARDEDDFVNKGNRLILNKIFRDELYKKRSREAWRSYYYK